MRITLWVLCVALFVCQQCLSVLGGSPIYHCLSIYSKTCRELDESSCNDHEHCHHAETRCLLYCDQVVDRFNYQYVDQNETNPKDASRPFNSYLEAQETCESIPGCSWGRTIEIYEEQGQAPFSSRYDFYFPKGVKKDHHGCYGLVNQCGQKERQTNEDTCTGDSIAVSWPQHLLSERAARPINCKFSNASCSTKCPGPAGGIEAWEEACDALSEHGCYFCDDYGRCDPFFIEDYLGFIIGGVALCVFCICFCVFAVAMRLRVERRVAADYLAKKNQTALPSGRSRKRNSVGSHVSSNRSRSARSTKPSFHSEM